MNELQKQRFAEALHRVANDESTLVMMAEITVTDAVEAFAELQRSLDGGDGQQIASGAHKLKGMLVAFETGDPVCDLEKIIATARSNDIDQCRTDFMIVEPKLKTLVREIEALASAE